MRLLRFRRNAPKDDVVGIDLAREEEFSPTTAATENLEPLEDSIEVDNSQISAGLGIPDEPVNAAFSLEEGLILSDWSNNFIDELSSCRKDLDRESIRSLLIDDSAYLRARMDVKEAGMCPLAHFIHHGYAEGAIPDISIVRTAPHSGSLTSEGMYTVYFGGPENNASFKYRCVFPHKKNENYSLFSSDSKIEEIILSIFKSSVAIFLRPEREPRTIYLLTLCKNIGVRIHIDYDDLLLPEFVLSMGSVRSGVVDQNDWAKQVEAHSFMANWADRITCSTPVIKSAFSDFTDYTIVSPNKLPREFFVNEADLGAGFSEDGEPLNILYASGTQTHIRDFSVAASGLIKFAQDNPGKVNLTFLGSTSLMHRAFRIYCSRVNVIGSLPFEDMLKEIGRHDVLIVPLEDTIFNNAKSNIKFIEAASRGVPIMASPAHEFKRTIEHGVNGWICSEPDSWYREIALLEQDRTLLRDVGRNAYMTAIENYSI